MGKGVARELDSRERTVLESAAFFSGWGRVNLWLITLGVKEGSIGLNTGMTELSSPSPVVSFVRDGALRGVNTAGPKCPTMPDLTSVEISAMGERIIRIFLFAVRKFKPLIVIRGGEVESLINHTTILIHGRIGVICTRSMTDEESTGRPTDVRQVWIFSGQPSAGISNDE